MIIGELVRGAVIRAEQNWIEPAGKGVNISRALAANGIATRAVFPSGGANGEELCRLLTAAGVDFIPVPIAGGIRSNVSVVEPHGATTKLNEAGPTLSPSDVDALVEAVVAASSSDGWVAASGSLAPGMPDDLYARLGRGLAGKGAKLAVDTSGRALRAAVAGGPGLLKPNRHELSELVDQPLATLGEVVAAAQEVKRAGVGQVLVSLGPDGAVLVDDTAVLHGEVSVDRVSNTVGAGDALLAGFLAGGAGGAGALANALGWARAAVRSPQTSMAPPGESDHEAARINVELDPDRLLEDDEASISPDSEASIGDGAVPSGQPPRSASDHRTEPETQ